MNIYRVMFADNQIASCEEANLKFDYEEEYYLECNGQISYAVVKANNDMGAIHAAAELVKDLYRKTINMNTTWPAAA